jgi:hypothetical protein
MRYFLSYEFSLHLLAALSAALGLLLIATRAPMIIYPEATRDAYLKVFKTNLRIRLLGLLVAGFALGFILASRHLASFLEMLFFLLGWAMALFSAVLLLLFTFLFREIVTSLLESMDPLILRVFGIASVLLGALFIYLGLII